MTIEDMQKTEKAVLAIREQLDNVVMPDSDTLNQINYEMANIFYTLQNLKAKVNTLENAFGSLEQYGIADELEQYIKEN